MRVDIKKLAAVAGLVSGYVYLLLSGGDPPAERAYIMAAVAFVAILFGRRAISGRALAVAGTGDVLAGAIAGFCAQGLAPFEAACCGAYLHGLAGEHWRQSNGDAGLLASDLLPLLPKALFKIR